MENIIHFLNSFWCSEGAVGSAVGILDYAGVVDVIAAVILLIIWLRRPRKALERRLTLFTILFSLFAGVLWVADSKLSHRLTVLQTAQSESRADAAEKAKNEAVQAAASAKEDAAKLHRRIITPEQRSKFIALLANAPHKPIWVVNDDTSKDTQELTWQVRGMLDEAGCPATNDIASIMPHFMGSLAGGIAHSLQSLGVDSHGHEVPFVLIMLRTSESRTNIPVMGVVLFNAFNMAGIPSFPINFTDDSMRTGEVAVLIPAK